MNLRDEPSDEAEPPRTRVLKASFLGGSPVVTAVIRAFHTMKEDMRVVIRTLLAAIVGGAFMAMAILAYFQVLEAQRQIDTFQNFRVVGMALQQHDSRFDGLPKATYFDSTTATPLYSWRYRILPGYASYKRECFFELAWDHPKNAIWHAVPQPFAPNGWIDGVWDKRPPSEIPAITNVYAITGEDTAFGNGAEIASKRLSDLPSDLVIVAEIRNSGHHWMKCGDFDIRELMKSTGEDPRNNPISGIHGSGFHVLFADLDVWFLSNKTPFDDLSKFLTITNATNYDRHQVLGKYRIR